MRNAADAALVTSLRWQALAARAIAAGLALVPGRHRRNSGKPAGGTDVTGPGMTDVIAGC